MSVVHSQCTSPEVWAAATAAVDPWFAPLSLAGRRWLLPPPLPLCCSCSPAGAAAGTAAAGNCATTVALCRCNPASLNPAAADTCWGTTAAALDDWSRHCRCRSSGCLCCCYSCCCYRYTHCWCADMAGLATLQSLLVSWCCCAGNGHATAVALCCRCHCPC
jgi:hypothetical protein